MSKLRNKKARKRAEVAESVRLDFMRQCASEAEKCAASAPKKLVFQNIAKQEKPKAYTLGCLDVGNTKLSEKDKIIAKFRRELARLNHREPTFKTAAKSHNVRASEAVTEIGDYAHCVDFVPTVDADTRKKLKTGKVRPHYVPALDYKLAANRYDLLKAEALRKADGGKVSPCDRVVDGRIEALTMDDLPIESFKDNLEEVKPKPVAYKSKAKVTVSEPIRKADRLRLEALRKISAVTPAKVDTLLCAKAMEPRKLPPLPVWLPTTNADLKVLPPKLGQTMTYLGTDYVLAQRGCQVGWVRLITDSKGNKSHGRFIELPYEPKDCQ